MGLAENEEFDCNRDFSHYLLNAEKCCGKEVKENGGEENRRELRRTEEKKKTSVQQKAGQMSHSWCD